MSHNVETKWEGHRGNGEKQENGQFWASSSSSIWKHEIVLGLKVICFGVLGPKMWAGRWALRACFILISQLFALYEGTEQHPPRRDSGGRRKGQVWYITELLDLFIKE